jgi:hypothetical protein
VEKDLRSLGVVNWKAKAQERDGWRKFLEQAKTHEGFSANNSIQFFIIYVPSQQLQGQLQTQHSVDTSNYIMDKHNLKSKSN